MNLLYGTRTVGSVLMVLVVLVVPIGCILADELHTIPDHGILTGTVVDTLCHKVANALVSVGTVGKTATTGPDGRFSVPFSPADIGSNQVLLVSTAPAGYAQNQTRVQLSASTHYDTTLVLKSISIRTMVNTPATEALIVQEPYRGWVRVPPSSLVNTLGVPITEPITAQLTTLDPMREDRMAFPGNHFLGMNPADQNSTVPLEVVAVAEVNVLGASGTRYHHLATKATLRLTIAAEGLGTLVEGDHLPLWFYDTTDGLWHSEGEGTVRSSPTDQRLWVEGQVTHLSWWSFAFPISEPACLRLRPVDAETHHSLLHLTFGIEGIAFVGGAQGVVEDDGLVFLSKKSQDSAHLAYVRLLFYAEGVPTYLRRDPAHANDFYTVSLAGLATDIPMPTIPSIHNTRWEHCQDLGLIKVSSRKPFSQIR